MFWLFIANINQCWLFMFSLFVAVDLWIWRQELFNFHPAQGESKKKSKQEFSNNISSAFFPFEFQSHLAGFLFCSLRLPALQMWWKLFVCSQGDDESSLLKLAEEIWRDNLWDIKSKSKHSVKAAHACDVPGTVYRANSSQLENICSGCQAELSYENLEDVEDEEFVRK